MIRMYTDGASRGNPGPGGYGVILKYGEHYKELSEGFRLTTNNRMELLAVIRGLESLKTRKLPITVYTDSRYVADAVTKGWLKNWLRKGFQGKKNEDLWRQYAALSQYFNVTFVWVRGHSGHPENERCDELAVAAALGGDLQPDAPFERTRRS